MAVQKRLTQALIDLSRKGYVYDFSQAEAGLYCAALDLYLSPGDYEIDKVMRFESIPEMGNVMVVCALNAGPELMGIFFNPSIN